MSYILKHLDSKDELEIELTKYPEHLLYYSKYDTFIGSPESIQYIQKLLKKAEIN